MPESFDSLILGLLPDQTGYLHGYADMTGLLDEKYAGYAGAIVLAKKLDGRIVDGIATGPTREYHEHYREANLELARVAAAVAGALAAYHIETLVIRPTFDDHELTEKHSRTLRTDFPHKTAATRAGLGWIGKTALLVTEQFGPRVRLASVLVKAALPCSEHPCTESRCGSCTVCVDRCPARAANGIAWNITIDRDLFFDAARCRAKCRELARTALGKDESLCGICVSVCPRGRKNPLSE